MNAPKFLLMQQVRIAISAETGVVIGRAEYMNAEPQYLIRYEARNGVATEAWWTESALESA